MPPATKSTIHTIWRGTMKCWVPTIMARVVLRRFEVAGAGGTVGRSVSGVIGCVLRLGLRTCELTGPTIHCLLYGFVACFARPTKTETEYVVWVT